MSYNIINKPFLIEINEKTHSEILDYFKEIDVYLTTGTKLNSMNLYKEFYSTFDTFKKFLHNFCIWLYKTGYKEQSITLHMVEFSNFSVDAAKVGVQLVSGSFKLALSEITKLHFFDESESPIDMDELIIKLYNINKINPEKDFINWEGIISEYQTDNCLNPIKPEYLLVLTMEKNNLILNTKGIMKILTNIPSNLWSRQDDYFEYLENLQTKYVQTVNGLLDEECSDLKITDRYIEFKNIVEIIKFDQDEYFQKIKEKMGNKKLSEIFHHKLPFLKKESKPEKFVNFTVYKNLVNQKYLDNVQPCHTKKIGKNTLENVELIFGYSVMSPNEIKQIYSMSQREFDDKYFNTSNNTIDFLN